MDLPINADVYCADGRCGVSTYIVLNPTTDKVTHLVVKEKQFPHTERLVPLDVVSETSPHQIRLRCTKHELMELEAFLETEFIRAEIPEYLSDPYMLSPYVLPKIEMIAVDRERIPLAELAVHRGAHVEAADGRAGQVDEFLVNPLDGHITHLVLREGHPWGQKDVTIPISQIERIEEEAVYLKLNKHEIEELPAIPIHRWGT